MLFQLIDLLILRSHESYKFLYRFSSLFDPTPTSKTENKDDSNKADSSTTSKPKSRFGSLFDDDSGDKKDSASPTKEQKDSESQEEGSKGDKVAITKVYDFAGEMVKVTKEVDADSKEAKKFQKEVESGSAGKVPTFKGNASLKIALSIIH